MAMAYIVILFPLTEYGFIFKKRDGQTNDIFKLEKA